LIPVTGNVQEYKKYGVFNPEDPINLYPDQIFWHFCDDEWCSPLDLSLQKIVATYQVQLSSMRDIYSSVMDIKMGETLDDFMAKNPYFMSYSNNEQYWHKHKPVYDKFRIAAECIVTQIIECETPLPHVVFAKSFLPLSEDKI
jgi:hypothetical protein